MNKLPPGTEACVEHAAPKRANAPTPIAMQISRRIFREVAKRHDQKQAGAITVSASMVTISPAAIAAGRRPH